MITIFVKNCNQISQSFYDSLLFDLQLHQLACSCSHSACLSIHGYYRRCVKLPSGTVRLRICSHYENRKNVCAVCERNPSVDENNVKSVLRNYRLHWREKLRSLRIPLYPLERLIHSCFAWYSSQFMQIHRRTNRLFGDTT